MYILRINYTKSKQAIYINQRDEKQVIERALNRIGAKLYVDDNSLPKIESALRIFSNMESTGEICDIYLEECIESSYVVQALNNNLPAGFVIMSAEILNKSTELISEKVYAAIYEIIPEFENIDNMTPRQIEDLNKWYKSSLKNFLMQEEINILIKLENRNERIEIKKDILDYEILINNGLKVTVKSDSKNLFNPYYIIEGFIEYIDKKIEYSIKRVKILYDK